jgi:hypothetical protein
MTFAQSLSGVTAQDFQGTDGADGSVVTTVADILNISESSVRVTSITDVPIEERRRSLIATVLLIEYVVTVLIQEVGYQDSNAASTFLSEQMNLAVTHGKFEKTLENAAANLGISLFKNASLVGLPVVTSIQVQYLSPVPSRSPTPAPSFQSNSGGGGGVEGALIGIIAAAVFLLLCFCIGVVYCVRRNKEEGDENTEGVEGIDSDLSKIDKVEKVDQCDIVEGGNSSTLLGGNLNEHNKASSRSSPSNNLGVVEPSNVMIRRHERTDADSSCQL